MNLFQHIKNFFSEETRIKSLSGLSGVAYVDTLFQNLVEDKKVPGIVVSVVKDGSSFLEKGYGYANLEERIPTCPKETTFRIASVSKCITGLALGKMVEEGILHWDDSFFSHVPYYPNKNNDFTLRQLASHTAGIRGYRGKEFALNDSYTIKESTRVFENDPLVFNPGQGYLYNSFDFVLLSLAMQEASKIPFQTYVKEKILSPLGMKNTFESEIELKSFNDFDTQFYTKASGDFRKATPVNNFYKLAGGGYLSTSVDIVKLGQDILEQKLLEKETYKELLTSQIVNNSPTYYGLGFQVSQNTLGIPYVGHVGSSIGAYSNLFIYPKEQLVIVILINCTDPKIQGDLDKAIEIILNT